MTARPYSSSCLRGGTPRNSKPETLNPEIRTRTQVLHTVMIWDKALSTTEMKAVTAALRQVGPSTPPERTLVRGPRVQGRSWVR